MTIYIVFAVIGMLIGGYVYFRGTNMAEQDAWLNAYKGKDPSVMSGCAKMMLFGGIGIFLVLAILGLLLKGCS